MDRQALELRCFRFATLNCPAITDQIMAKGCLFEDD